MLCSSSSNPTWRNGGGHEANSRATQIGSPCLRVRRRRLSPEARCVANCPSWSELGHGRRREPKAQETAERGETRAHKRPVETLTGTRASQRRAEKSKGRRSKDAPIRIQGRSLGRPAGRAVSRSRCPERCSRCRGLRYGRRQAFGSVPGMRSGTSTSAV